MSDFIVIAQPLFRQAPNIVLRTPNEEHARAEAHTQLRRSKRDVQVYDLDTYLCVLALTDEPEDTP